MSVVMHRISVAVILSLMSLPALAGVYKCINNQGQITYQQNPCSGQGEDGSGNKLQIHDSSTGLGDITPSEKRYLNEIRAMEAKQRAAALRRQLEQQREQQREQAQEAARKAAQLRAARLEALRRMRLQDDTLHVIPAFPPGIATDDGRFLYPNDPQGNTYTGSRGHYYIREGDSLLDTNTNQMLYP